MRFTSTKTMLLKYIMFYLKLNQSSDISDELYKQKETLIIFMIYIS